jgi:hypothetical protein
MVWGAQNLFSMKRSRENLAEKVVVPHTILRGIMITRTEMYDIKELQMLSLKSYLVLKMVKYFVLPVLPNLM